MATDLEFEKFIELVRQMRHNQRRFNRFKTPEIKATLEKLENEVDAIVAVKTTKQTKLF